MFNSKAWESLETYFAELRLLLTNQIVYSGLGVNDQGTERGDLIIKGKIVMLDTLTEIKERVEKAVLDEIQKEQGA